MLDLTHEDISIIEKLASERSTEDQREYVTSVLTYGFSFYGDKALVSKFKSRQKFFEESATRLIENYPFTGRTCEEAFALEPGRDYLCRLVGSMGVHPSDVEDVVQDITRKFLKHRWAERYNPLISSWPVALYEPIRRYVVTYKTTKSKKLTYKAASLDECDLTNGKSSLASSLYQDQDVDPESRLLVDEFLMEWVDFLSVQKPFRDTLHRGFHRMCTLIPPGTKEFPTDEELELCFLISGPLNCRVTAPDLHERGLSYMVPVELLVDYIQEDAYGNRLTNPDTGEFLTQKFYKNPEYDPKAVPVRIERSLLDLYRCLKDGLQVDEIAREFRVAPTSVPAWVQKLEVLFRDFWLITNRVPARLKDLAVRTYKCPGCGKLERRTLATCRYCGDAMGNQVSKIRLDLYPWPRVCGNRGIQDKLEMKKIPVVIQQCKV